MTAVKRPEILRSTLTSFCDNLFTERDRYRLIINIDSIGEKVKPKNIIKICKLFFKPEQIVYRVVPPSFPNAVIWTWSQVEAPWVFHLEDDWTIRMPVDINDMIRIMKKHSLTSLRLNKTRTKKNKTSKKYGFTPCPKISLNPNLFDGTFIKKMATIMTSEQNPEKQLRIGKGKHPRGKLLMGLRHGIYSKLSYRAMVTDIGRDWMNKSRFSKRIGFKNWIIRGKK
jgi:hypothetical protein